MTDLDNIHQNDIRDMDNDCLLDLAEEVGFAYVKVIIETIKRTDDAKFTGEQVKRMSNIILNQTCAAYDSVEITKEQMDIGTESIKHVLFDTGR